MKKTIIAVLMIAVLFGGTSIASAKGSYSYSDEPSGHAMFFDALLIRPMAIGAAAVGLGVFVATLPFALISRSVKSTSNKLIVEPALYAFTRPVGEI